MESPPPPHSSPRSSIARGSGVLVARALSVLGLAAASLALAVQELAAGPVLAKFVKENVLSDSNRQRLLLTLLGSILVTVGVLATGWLVRGRRLDDQQRLTRLGRLGCPLVLAAFVPPLAQRGLLDQLSHVLTMTGFVLVLEAVLRVSLAEWQRPSQVVASPRPGKVLGAVRRLGRRLAELRWLPLALVAAAAVGFAGFIAFFTIRTHLHFGTAAYDLGQYDSLFWNALHGHPFRCPALLRGEPDWSSLRGHAEPSIYVLMPVYALFPRAETLLVLQAVLVGSAALPVYWIAARRLPRSAAVVLAFAYLLYAPMHGGIFYDVHFQPFGASFALWAIDALDRRRYLLYGVLFAIALGCREDVPILFMVLGAFLILSGHHVRAGLATLLVSVVYFGVMRFWIMPRAGSWFFADIYKQLQPPGDASYRGILKTLLTNPTFVVQTLLTEAKLRYALQILLPLALLPLRRPWLWASLLPGAAVTLLTTQSWAQTDIAFQYVAYFPPLIFPAAALALASYGNDAAGGGEAAGGGGGGGGRDRADHHRLGGHPAAPRVPGRLPGDQLRPGQRGGPQEEAGAARADRPGAGGCAGRGQRARGPARLEPAEHVHPARRRPGRRLPAV